MDGKVGIGTTSPAYKLHVVGDIYTTGTYQGSDLRLKDQVQDLGYGVREVLRLRPVSYRWKDATLGQPTLGLIAQEVEPVLPELVARGTDEAGLLSLNYTGLVPVLVKAVQEQEGTIRRHHARAGSEGRGDRGADGAARGARGTDAAALAAGAVESSATSGPGMREGPPPRWRFAFDSPPTPRDIIAARSSRPRPRNAVLAR